METTTLVMYFLDRISKKISVSINDPKADLTPHDVQTAMNGIIEDAVLVGTEGVELVEAHSAQIVTRTVNPLMMD